MTNSEQTNIKIKSFDSYEVQYQMLSSQPSRSELLTWISQLTNKTTNKIQDLSDGVLFCEVFDKVYPKYIHLQKLKRDPKIPLEKEKNFRLLLNAINHVGLSVQINIIDLSNGKITALLDLLQWFYREYKNPLAKSLLNEQNNQQVNETRMIKSYVGNLVIRQKSCHKQLNGESSKKSLTRKSLDSKVLKKSLQLPQSRQKKMSKSKSLKKIQNKENSSQVNNSKVKKITLDDQAFQLKCNEKREEIKKAFEQKGSKSIKQIKQQNVSLILKKALNLERPKLQETLIRITETALESNPELRQKIQILLQNVETNQKDTQTFQEINLNQNKHQKSFDYNEALKSAIRLQKNQSQTQSFIQLEKIPNHIDFNHLQDEKYPSREHQFSQNKERQNRINMKEILNKSMMKSGKEKPKNTLMSQKSSRQISINEQPFQKDCRHQALNIYKIKAQNTEKFAKLSISPSFGSNNPGMYVSENKADSRKKFQKNNYPRQVRSEKQQLNFENSQGKQDTQFQLYPKLN